MKYNFFVLALLCCTACGLSDDPREEEKKHTYITFTDPAFGKYCLEAFDLSKDGRVSVYEAERVRDISCPGLGIVSLADLSYFINLERLDCADNALTDLDLRRQTRLGRGVCARNRIVSLDVRGLRALAYLDCAGNDLGQLDLTSDVSLSTLLCGDNRLTTLDVSRCSVAMERVAAQGNPQLTTLYIRRGQTIAVRNLDGQTQVVER